MGWIEALYGKKVGVDTAPFIYYLEDKPVYADMLHPFFQAVTSGQISIVTSLITLLEVLVLPVRRGDTTLADKYRQMLFRTENVATHPISHDIIEEAARLRASHNIRTPDALQMATAINQTASLFLKNDIRLPSLPNFPLLALDKLKSEPLN